jgi:hypothetical protein
MEGASYVTQEVKHATISSQHTLQLPGQFSLAMLAKGARGTGRLRTRILGRPGSLDTVRAGAGFL